MQETERLPSHAAMAWPALVAIKRAGGSATNAEIMETVARDLHLSEQQRTRLRRPRGSRTLLDYRLGWSRTLLKNMGAIINDAPCHWTITDVGRRTTQDDVQRFIDEMLSRFQTPKGN
jgi:restriction system protein